MEKILILEKDNRVVGKIKVSGGDLVLVSAASEHQADIKNLLKKIKNDGAELRQCVEGKDNAIIESLVPISSNDSKYGYALLDEFTRANFRAVMLDAERSELWEVVRLSKTDLVFQEAVLRNIHLLKDDLISDIKKEFEAYGK